MSTPDDSQAWQIVVFVGGNNGQLESVNVTSQLNGLWLTLNHINSSGTKPGCASFTLWHPDSEIFKYSSCLLSDHLSLPSHCHYFFFPGVSLKAQADKMRSRSLQFSVTGRGLASLSPRSVWLCLPLCGFLDKYLSDTIHSECLSLPVSHLQNSQTAVTAATRDTDNADSPGWWVISKPWAQFPWVSCDITQHSQCHLGLNIIKCYRLHFVWLSSRAACEEKKGIWWW